MLAFKIRYLLPVAMSLAVTAACAQDQSKGWQDQFALASCNMVPTGRNQYFVLEPGFQLVLEDDETRLEITVLDDTKTVDGVVTRVVEEREFKDKELYEVSRNYFAMCEQTKDVFYFGEDVDYYEKGKVTKHDGSWLAGQGANRPGMIMAGTPKPKMKYYQEIAPEVAMDRAEIVSLAETCKTPAGTFTNCLKVKEGSALGLESEYKYYAPEIGLIQDEDLKLVRYGFVEPRAGRATPISQRPK